MNIKDFAVGQTVWLSVDNGYGKRHFERATVDKIGRKYLTIKQGIWCLLFGEEDYFPDGLVEKKDWGISTKLFPSRQAMSDYYEREELLHRMRSEIANNCYRSNSPYTLDQLRRVMAILEKEDTEYETSI